MYRVSLICIYSAVVPVVLNFGGLLRFQYLADSCMAEHVGLSR